MPELKPCPFCGAQPTLRENIYYGSGEYLASINCPCINGDVAESYFLRSGETQKQATNKSIAAWNTRTEPLPRALTWTTEPPKVAGWYWCRPSTLNMPRCVEVYGAWEQLMFGSKRDDYNPQMPVTREGFEWAGPIPMPLEPEES
ncbi:MAG: Lar family restriction alleviation protein [Desulfovibrio desulfuricans]|nr:Lar family restriction alleviation protein [Desulfovibrio desulfuricans]